MVLGVVVLEWRAETSRGLVRPENEDSWLVSNLARAGKHMWLAMVADGIGGHDGGEIASSLAVNSVSECFSQSLFALFVDKPEDALRSAVLYANSKILESSARGSGVPGMGTTLTCTMIDEKRRKAYFGHIGDSRAYVISGGSIMRITDDHSLSGELLKNGTITEEDAMRHPGRNVLTAALGAEEEIRIATYERDLLPHDIVLLCTDGLTGLVRAEEIFEAAMEYGKDGAAQKLVELANSRGGYDNITVVLLWPLAAETKGALRGEVG